jgi:hypothetical protein
MAEETDNNENNILDLIGYAYNQKPLEFSKSFDQILRDKATTTVDNIKYDIAQSMFNDNAESDEEENDKYDDNEESDGSEIEYEDNEDDLETEKEEEEDE